MTTMTTKIEHTTIIICIYTCFFGCLELFVSGIFTCDGVVQLSFLIGCLAVMLASVMCLSWFL